MNNYKFQFKVVLAMFSQVETFFADLPTAYEYDKGGYKVLHLYLIYYIYNGIVMRLNQVNI